MSIIQNKYTEDFFDNPAELLIRLHHEGKRVQYHATKALLFLRICISEFSLNHCISRASSIAYALLLTLIPLVVTAAFMLASLTDINSEQVKRLFSLFLPFAPEIVLSYLSTFFENAKQLRGVGIVVLIIVSMGLFGTFEESLNNIWKVNRSRSFFVRLRTFTMVVVYSPILFFASVQFRRSIPLNFDFSGQFVLDLVPFILMVLAFSTMIWFVPNTKVHFKSAILGGLISAILFEIERRSFATYVQFSLSTSTVYGALGILPLFLLSLFFVAFFILIGAQVAYVMQNFRPLLRAKRRWDRRVGDYKSYFTFRILLDCIKAYVRKRAPPTIEQLSKKYDLTEQQASGIAKWLVHEKYLHQVGGLEAYVPAYDFSCVSVREMLEAIDNQNRRVPVIPDDFTRDYVDSLMKQLGKSDSAQLDSLSFAEMVTEIDVGEKRANRSAVVMK
ncbi:MAG TPA: YhjD/YihY/BrkB family envelope integrity protein [Chitinispirillaceae bacterium]|nr:YhjD/YihY/BrkB family envelope integrity protein [Chitinispirillaceae bacterium]